VTLVAYDQKQQCSRYDTSVFVKPMKLSSRRAGGINQALSNKAGFDKGDITAGISRGEQMNKQI